MSIMVQHRRLGLVDSTIARLDAVVNEYDEKLHLDRHPDTGQWTLYVDMERPMPHYPVFVLPTPLPTADALRNKLVASDTQRQDIRLQMNKANAAMEAEIDRKSRQEVGKAAEVVEYLARKQGMLSDNTSRRKINQGR